MRFRSHVGPCWRVLTGKRTWKHGALDKRAGRADLRHILHDAGKSPLEHVHVLEQAVEHSLGTFECVPDNMWIHVGVS